MSVTQLGYIRYNVSDVKSWEAIGSQVLGMEVMPRRNKNAPLCLRMDERHHRFALYPAQEDSLRAIGWEVGNEHGMEKAVSSLEAAGVRVTEGTKEEVADRHVFALAKFTDIHGLPGELFYGPDFVDPPFRPSRPMSGYNTQGVGLGHVVVTSDNPPELVEFYRNVLGFKLSDILEFLGVRVTFLRCNERHHTLAIVNSSPSCPHAHINHIMVEARSLDDVGRAYDLCESLEIPITLTLGRHPQDNMTSFYMVSPSGFALECGYGCMRIEDDDAWDVRHFTTPSMWGHKMVAPSTLTFRPGSADFRQ